MPVLTSIGNGDETKYAQTQPASFTKGLHHDEYGLAPSADYAAFCHAVAKGDPEMGGLQIAAGPDQRKWESPIAGNYFNDMGADPDAVAMPPAPKLGRSELCAELAAVYAMALTRDLPFEALQKANTPIPHITTGGSPVTVGDLVNELRKLSWFDTNGTPVGFKGMALTDHERRRREANWETKSKGLTVDVLFRGSTPGAKKGPYISQFMLIGTDDLSGTAPAKGQIAYGLQTITQAQLVPEAEKDYMTTWADWLEVQQGQGFDQPPHKTRRRIHTPRDLAGYVHFDALYQAYLNACLILLGNGLEVDGGNPIAQERPDNSIGFATWGGPHILSLVTEVATRGLRAARRTKFQVHRRARPEVLAARLTQVANAHVGHMDPGAVIQIGNMLSELGFNPENQVVRPGSILDWITQHNKKANNGSAATPIHDDKNFLLPMAFVEGSPMHPAFGAGHATVAGACVTILKAFFEGNAKYSDVIKGGGTHYAADKADNLVASHRKDGNDATVSEELDKLAANISIGRNIAGVHYYSDYYDSLRMGERIAVSILEEQMHTYHEPVSLSLTSFDGDAIKLGTTGGTGPAAVKVKITNASGLPELRDTWWTRDLEDYGIVEDGSGAGV
ncbi:MAG: hypothetical protein QNJ44_14970 [Rhodobacter sp.]|nr:hypothetical protein [Rhodobacter sp.]